MSSDQVQVYTPHKNGKINAMNITGSICFTASYDSSIVATDLSTGLTLRAFMGHIHSITSLLVTNNSKFDELVAAASDGNAITHQWLNRDMSSLTQLYSGNF